MLFTQLIRWMNKMSRALKMKHTLCIVEESDYNMYHLTTGYVIHKLVVIREFEIQKMLFCNIIFKHIIECNDAKTFIMT